MTLPPWRHHRSMLSKWLPSRARTVRIVPSAERSAGDGPQNPADRGAAAGPAEETPQSTAQPRPSRGRGATGEEFVQRSTADARQSPVRPRASQAGSGASSRPTKRAHAAQPASASSTGIGASPNTAANPGTGRPVSSSLRRSSLLSKELEAQRAPPPPKVQQPSTAVESSLRSDSTGGRSGLSRHSGGGYSSDGSTHGATAACPRIRTVKLRGSSGSGGGGRAGAGWACRSRCRLPPRRLDITIQSEQHSRARQMTIRRAKSVRTHALQAPQQ